MMHPEDPNPVGGDLVLAVQVVLVSMWSGVVAWLNRWNKNPLKRRAFDVVSLGIDIITSSLVGFSVYLLAASYGVEFKASLLLAIIAGHYGARWFGLLADRARIGINAKEPGED